MLANQQEITFSLLVVSTGLNFNKSQIHSISKICFDRPEIDAMYLEKMYWANVFEWFMPLLWFFYSNSFLLTKLDCMFNSRPNSKNRE